MGSNPTLSAQIDGGVGILPRAAWFANFHPPSLMVGPATSLLLDSDEQASAALGPVVASLRERGFDRSMVDECRVQLLTAGTALASAVFTRLAGEVVLERFGATYLLAKRGDRWGVVVVTGHPAESLPIT